MAGISVDDQDAAGGSKRGMLGRTYLAANVRMLTLIGGSCLVFPSIFELLGVAVDWLLAYNGHSAYPTTDQVIRPALVMVIGIITIQLGRWAAGMLLSGLKHWRSVPAGAEIDRLIDRRFDKVQPAVWRGFLSVTSVAFPLLTLVVGGAWLIAYQLTKAGFWPLYAEFIKSL
ncbi:hypothetical protein N7676_15790 [Stenotrophomonas sp. GD03993]|uniref:hypothetical protein n=1 Tax=unclassified Stenotrophomonas TaxID=196198 RepID=UPI00244B0D3D|nr:MULTISPECIES: hypothetical protein [unclassified Stenotrophomonas]MDH0190258.1 hypothetical protein [Stenotrophomonas sp. GD04051]MDH0465268.1 hypothetical protein [Stenotrophomonas sp. GD03993]MDH0877887.1 hypothetical protein [Stenotrophomonas sp. GD03877]